MNQEIPDDKSLLSGTGSFGDFRLCAVSIRVKAAGLIPWVCFTRRDFKTSIKTGLNAVLTQRYRFSRERENIKKNQVKTQEYVT